MKLLSFTFQFNLIHKMSQIVRYSATNFMHYCPKMKNSKRSFHAKVRKVEISPILIRGSFKRFEDSVQKEFLGYVFFARRNSNFFEKRVTKIELQNRQLFSSNFQLCQFSFIFPNKSQVFSTTGQNMIDIWPIPLAKKNTSSPKMCNIRALQSQKA